jgi:hypothetical protein
MNRRAALAGIVAILAALVVQAAAAGAASTSAAAACSTHGLRFPAAKSAKLSVVSLRSQGVSCKSARKVASRVAEDLLHGRTVSVSGAIGFGMTEESCSGCGGTTTSVSISYRHGKVTVSLRGAGSTGGGGVIPFPTTPFPAPTAPSGGSGTIV